MEMDHLIKLIETVSRSGLSRFEYEEDGVKVQMEKPEAVQAAAALPSVEAVLQEEETARDQVVTCPLVGIFTRRRRRGLNPL